MKDPFRDPDAYIEHLCKYVTDDSMIAAMARREFSGKITVQNVRAARNKMAKKGTKRAA